MSLNRFIAAATLAASALPAVAQAQTETAPAHSALDGDYLTIGAGAIYGPSYEGSDDQVVTGFPIVTGRLAGIDITPRPGGIALDLIPDGKDPKFGFSLGPVVTYSRDRRSNIKDPVVRAAGRLKSAIDVGFNAGVTAYKLLNAYDSVTLSTDVRWNVNSASKGMVVTPSLTYATPLSRAALVTVGITAKHVDGDYARYYYSVTPAQSAASGLPVFGARGGWASVGVNALAGYDLDGDVLNGGFALFALGRYSKLLNDAKTTPYTSIRGDDSQWTIGGGVAYTF
ncbi:MAG: MipA/OmpV family protein [Novosphingobium sp.]